MRFEVTLHDGQVVDSWSEEWRAECEARHILTLPSKAARIDYLARVQSKRKGTSREDLEKLVWSVWKASRRAAG